MTALFLQKKQPCMWRGTSTTDCLLDQVSAKTEVSFVKREVLILEN